VAGRRFHQEIECDERKLILRPRRMEKDREKKLTQYHEANPEKMARAHTEKSHTTRLPQKKTTRPRQRPQPSFEIPQQLALAIGGTGEDRRLDKREEFQKLPATKKENSKSARLKSQAFRARQKRQLASTSPGRRKKYLASHPGDQGTKKHARPIG